MIDSNQGLAASRIMMIPVTMAVIIRHIIEKITLVATWVRKLPLFVDDMVILS